MASNPTPHHSANTSTILSIENGEELIIQPQDLNIVWGKDNRYWNIPQKRGSPAELNQVSWLEVTGLVEGTRTDKRYKVGFRLSLNPDAFGWGKHPIYIMVKRGKKGKTTSTKVAIDPNRKDTFDISATWEWDKDKDDQSKESDDGKLYFGMYEVWSGKWKGGLNIHYAFIKQLRPRST